MPMFIKYRLKKMFEADAPLPDADKMSLMAERLGLSPQKRRAWSSPLVNVAVAAAVAAFFIAIGAIAVLSPFKSGQNSNVPAMAVNGGHKTETIDEDCVFCLVDEEDVENALLGMESDNIENVVAQWQGRLSN